MNTIIEFFLEQVDHDGWDTGLLKEIISFQYDPNVAIPIVESTTLALGYRALRGLPRCTARGEGEGA